MPAPVRSAFAQRVGADTRTLHSELEKLKMYIGPSRDTVTMEDLEAVTSSVASGEPFDLVSAIQLRSPLQVARGVERLRIDTNAAVAAAAPVS